RRRSSRSSPAPGSPTSTPTRTTATEETMRAEHDVEHDENVSGEEEDWSDEGDALVEGEEDTPHLARVAKPASSRARARPEPRPTPPAPRSASVARRGGGTAAIAANVAEDLD